MPVPKKTSTKRGPKFVAKSAPAPSTGKDGGKNLGTLTRCPATRAHPNVRQGY